MKTLITIGVWLLFLQCASEYHTHVPVSILKLKVYLSGRVECATTCIKGPIKYNRMFAIERFVNQCSPRKVKPEEEPDNSKVRLDAEIKTVITGM
uniref:Uncharacterized protein n=2 Tax=Nothobranchius pienaari TaxID=704102 RepID=A0A1A8L4C1_9TELE